MVHVGVCFEGKPNYPLKKLDNGLVVPDASISEIYQSHQQQVRTQVERAVVADELGYDYVVHPELHFSLLGAISPNPVQVQTAIAQRTDDVRLLQMANILPWHDPVRLAEQLATLDILSDGRAEIGIGRGIPIHALEAATLGQYWGGSVRDPLRNHKSFEEKLEVLQAAWQDAFVSHRGEFHSVPPSYTEWDNDLEYHYLADDTTDYHPTDYMSQSADTVTLDSLFVSPPPQQQPHPQLWKPTMSPQSVEWAARRGVNGFFVVRDFSKAVRFVDRYHEVAETAGWPDHRPEYDGDPFRRGWDAHRRRGVVSGVTVFNTEVADEETFERWKLGQEFALSSMAALRNTDRADKSEIDAEKRIYGTDNPIVGDSDEIIDSLAEFEETCGYEDFAVFVTMNVPGMTYDEKVAQIRSFAEDVLPYLEDESYTAS